SAKGLYCYWNMDSVNNDTILDLGANGISAIGSNVTVMNNGAPVGNTSTYVSGTNSFVFVNAATGDSVMVDSLNNISGLYVYQVNAAPDNSSIPSGVSAACASYYYGVFIPGYTDSSYVIAYYYASTGCTAQRQSNNPAGAISLVLLDKNAYTSYNWAISKASLSGSKFRLVSQSGQNELMVGTIMNTAGIVNNANHALKVNGISPNPFSSNFMLALNCDKNSTVKAHIMSLDGKLVSETTMLCNQGENQINFENMSEMANGIYFLNLSDGEGYATTIKMIKN
ncbi:MAG TPA: T9SS type A sorting domain-containing protein, partial [Bacteroidia bacterium]|nr:T9SS type A sorting domain-containing protein [Bacteroidia bacterium]